MRATAEPAATADGVPELRPAHYASADPRRRYSMTLPELHSPTGDRRRTRCTCMRRSSGRSGSRRRHHATTAGTPAVRRRAGADDRPAPPLRHDVRYRVRPRRPRARRADDRRDMRTFPLTDGLAVADFDARLHAALAELGVDVEIEEEPFGVPMKTPFREDTEHASWDRDAVERFHRPRSGPARCSRSSAAGSWGRSALSSSSGTASTSR